MAPDIQNTHVELGSAEIYFAKKLANNDKKIREKALKKLKFWLQSKGKSSKGFNFIYNSSIFCSIFTPAVPVFTIV